MQKYKLSRPTLILMLGAPGAGKTFFSRQMSELLGVGHISGDRIRYELYNEPKYDDKENEVVSRVMDYMAETFLEAGISAIYDDISIAKYQDRLKRRQLALEHKAHPVTVWVQTDISTCFQRANTRDRRRTDERYSHSIDKATFERLKDYVEKPQYREEYAVISGKYVFESQATAVIRRLRELKLLQENDSPQKMAPPTIRPLSSPRREQSPRQIRIR